MGSKKNQKKWDKLNPYEKLKAEREMAEAFNLDANDYKEYSFMGANDDRSPDKQLLSDAVANAASNDYDYRRSIEAASMAGNKKAQKIGGIGSIADAYAAHKFMKKTHRNRMENGGAYDGANDQAGVTNYWVEKDREKMLKPLAQTSDLNKLKNKLLKDATGGREQSLGAYDPAEPSDRLAQAHARIGAAAHDPSSLYTKNNQDVAKKDDQADAVREFLTDYKDDVSKGARLRDAIKSNVGNAADVVTQLYGR